MQTLGISNSTPPSENRFKNLFWSSIQTAADVDYLGTQGYWVCTIVATISLGFLLIAGMPILAVTVFLFYYVGGVGVREHSVYAATVIFILFLADTIATPGVLRIILLGLLLSNVRATWISANWTPTDADSTMPIRLSETWSDNLADVFPAWLWPKARVVYYVFSCCYMALAFIGVLSLFFGIHFKPNR